MTFPGLVETFATLYGPDVAAALSEIKLMPVATDDLRPLLARLRYQVPPGYLPFATFQGAPLAIHLWPGRPIADSPIVQIDQGAQHARFVAARFSDLPRAAWLWVVQYYHARIPILRSAVDRVASGLPEARPVSTGMWSILDNAPAYEPTWWTADAAEETRAAWIEADVRHPFVAFVPVKNEPAAAVRDRLAAVVAAQAAPEALLLAAWLAAAEAAGGPLPEGVALAILNSEAWLGGGPVFRNSWTGWREGLSEWTMALGIALRKDLLAGTAFEPLRGHADAYSGADPQGIDALRQVATNLAGAGDHDGALRQLRNAAYVAIYARDARIRELCAAIGDACDRIAPESPATAIARLSAEVSEEEA